MKNKKESRTQRTPARKLRKEDLTSITGGGEVLLRGCCTQGCCGLEPVLR